MTIRSELVGVPNGQVIEHAVPVAALRALLERWKEAARAEAERQYKPLTTGWNNIRTVEGRTKELCARDLAALCDAQELK